MRCAKSQKLYNMVTVPLQICNLQQYEQMLQKFYCFIFHFLSPLSSFFLFSSLSLFGSLSLLPVQDVHQQRQRRSSDDDNTLRHACSATLDLTHARSRQSHPEAVVNLTLFPLLSVCLSLCLSLVVGFFFFFLLQFRLI